MIASKLFYLLFSNMLLYVAGASSRCQCRCSSVLPFPHGYQPYRLPEGGKESAETRVSTILSLLIHSYYEPVLPMLNIYFKQSLRKGKLLYYMAD